jgi:hypothetical protein
VQAAIPKDPALKPFQIGVKTFKDKAKPSGFFDSPLAVRRAGTGGPGNPASPP